ncbi:host attachment family protein [Cereibacter sp. SYSU M97828]|nr:host attachment family protein [Cereibacter flavus]
MNRLLNGTWVVVADGEKALFFENEGDGQYPVLRVRREETNDNPPDREQGTDKPGRMGDGRSGIGSSAEETDFHRLEKDRFAQSLADLLFKLAHKGKFDRLVIVAPPQTLGAMRPHLHKEVQAKIILEIPKTLTGMPVDQIEKNLLAELA